MKILRSDVLPREFYNRDPSIVAKKLLGKLLLRKIHTEIAGGIIVETEAYYGIDDPASRAYGGKVTKISKIMYEEPGTVLVYMVHANWLFNIITEPPGVPSGVLVRAIEPKYGLEIMMQNRGTHDLYKLCRGPGRLTKALAIDNSFNGYKVYDISSPVFVADYEDYEADMIIAGKRIGVARDLDVPLRFYVKDNKFVSK